MNPLFTLGEEFRFHDSSRFRKKAGDAKLPFYQSFVQVLMSLAAESCRSRAESVHLLNPICKCGKGCKSSNFVTPDDSARNRKMRKMMSLNCSICLMPIYGVGKVYRIWTPKGGPPQYDDEGKRANSISGPVSNRQTGQTPRPLPKQPDIQTETTEGDPSERLISTTKRQGEVGSQRVAERAVFHQPATYCTEAALQERWRALDFPSRKLRRRPTAADLAEFRTKQADLRRNAVMQEQLNPVSFFPWEQLDRDSSRRQNLFTIMIQSSVWRRLPLPPFSFSPVPVLSHWLSCGLIPWRVRFPAASVVGFCGFVWLLRLLWFLSPRGRAGLPLPPLCWLVCFCGWSCGSFLALFGALLRLPSPPWPLRKHVSMVQLLVQQVSKLVQARREMPESQEAVVRRPVKGAQSGRLLPLLWSNSPLGWYDHLKRDPDGPNCLKAVHGGRLYDTHLVSSFDFWEAVRGFVVFVDTKVDSWGFLINEPDCVKGSGSLVSLHPGLSSGAGYCHFLRILWCTSLIQKAGAILLAQLAGNHAKSAATPLVRLTPPCGRSCGWVGTDTLTGPLGARFRLIVAVSVAAPMSSDRIGRNQ